MKVWFAHSLENSNFSSFNYSTKDGSSNQIFPSHIFTDFVFTANSSTPHRTIVESTAVRVMKLLPCDVIEECLSG